jgi:hypothetical protein
VSVNAAYSEYKKMNVRRKHQDPLVDRRRLYKEHGHSQSRKTALVSRRKSVALSPTVSDLHESQRQTFAASSYPYWNVSDFGSGRMYLNPHFLKASTSLESRVAAEDITSERKDVSKLKHSVHINPKVLGEQVLKATAQSQGTQLQTQELQSGPSGTNSPTSKYTFHSATKLVKQDAVTYHTTTSNMVRHKVVRRRSTLSWSRFRRSSVKSSEVSVRAAKAVCSKHKMTSSNMAKSPITISRYSYVANKITSGEESKYKIDRRLHRTPKTFKKYSLQYEMPKQGKSNQRIMNSKVGSKCRNGQYPVTSLKFGNETWSNSLRPQTLMVVNKKLRKM